MYLSTIGGDPEFFMQKNGTPLPSVGLLGGTKEKPKYAGKGFYIQEDNVMGEINIPVCDTQMKWNIAFYNTHKILDGVTKKVGATAKIVPSMYFDQHLLETEQAKTFGCSPDLNAWTLKHNNDIIPDKNIRYAGGHVHIGVQGKPINKSVHVLDVLIARMCDVYLGLPSVLLDNDNIRRAAYGSPGRYRHKNYGIEYRVLSNFWLNDIHLWTWVYRAARISVYNATSYKDIVMNKGISGEDIQDTISSGNINKAEKLIKIIDVPMPKGFSL